MEPSVRAPTSARWKPGLLAHTLERTPPNSDEFIKNFNGHLGGCTGGGAPRKLRRKSCKQINELQQIFFEFWFASYFNLPRHLSEIRRKRAAMRVVGEKALTA